MTLTSPKSPKRYDDVGFSKEPLIADLATPLSDLIAAVARKPGDRNSRAFLECFLASQVGVAAIGTPQQAGTFVTTAAQPVSLGMTTHAGGQQMVLAFADPPAFAAKYGVLFNATMTGEAVLRTALFNNDCHGVLVNSACEEISQVISRQTAIALLTPRKPWWKFW